MDVNRIKQIRSLIEFLSRILGDHYEIVFHVITEDKTYIDTIINGHISGRTEDSPLTKFALELIESKVYLERHYVTHYKTVTKDNKRLQGSTFFIMDDNNQNIEGMLCFNLDYSGRVDLANAILKDLNLSLLPGELQAESLEVQPAEDDFTEILSESVKDTIKQFIGVDLQTDNLTLTQEARLDIVKVLEEKNIFQLKGAVTEVADLLGVSEPTIYRYRTKIQKEKMK